MNTPEPTGPRKITAEDPPESAKDVLISFISLLEYNGTIAKEVGARARGAVYALAIAADYAPTAPATPPPAGTATPEERIGGWRITPEGLIMNGPMPPTREETQAYLADERDDLLDANAKLNSQLADMSKAFDELRAHVVRAEEDNASLRHELAAVTALLEKRTGALERLAPKYEALMRQLDADDDDVEEDDFLYDANAALAATPEQALKEKEGAS